MTDGELSDHRAYWAEQASNLAWDETWNDVLDWTDPPFAHWFVGARLNASVNCLDRHVDAGHGDRVAYYCLNESGRSRQVTYANLLDQVQRLANVLRSRGIKSGDVVAIFLPVIAETAVAALACARIGATYSSVFSGFSDDDFQERILDCDAKALITVDGIWRGGAAVPIKAPLDEPLRRLDQVRTVIVVENVGIDYPRQPGRDFAYQEQLSLADPVCAPVSVDAGSPLFISYTSGSTGKPKAIVHSVGGFLVGVASTYRQVFDLDPDRDLIWAAADVPLVSGHAYLVWGPLLNGAQSVLFEGLADYPDRGIWWSVVERFRVTKLLCMAPAIHTHAQAGDEYPKQHDLSSLELIAVSTGALSDGDYSWYRQVVGGDRCPVVATWWQTETGHPVIGSLTTMPPPRTGAAGLELPGINAAILDDAGNELGANEIGNLVLTTPWPAMPIPMAGGEPEFVSRYWSRFGPDQYASGDMAHRDSDGFLWIDGRVDDVVKTANNKLMAVADIEATLVDNPAVYNAAVVGYDTPTPALLVALIAEPAVEPSPELGAHLAEIVRARLGGDKVAIQILWVDDLPRNPEGKIVRRLIRDAANGESAGSLANIVNPESVEILRARISAQLGRTSRSEI